jgi:V/A-type H+/Na+-transporting ATPase subunit C
LFQVVARAAGVLPAQRLEQMRGFYTDQPRELVDLLLARHELRNLVTVLRGCAHGSPVEEVLAALVPVGRLTEPVVELAAQADLPAAVGLLVRHRSAGPAATELLAAVGDFQLHADQAALETDLARGHARWLAATLDRLGPAAAALRDLVAREVDETNLLTALRHRGAVMAGELPGGTPAPAPLEGGRLFAATLVRLAEAVDPGGAAATLARTEPAWQTPLQHWLEHGDLASLATDLEACRLADTVRLFATGDPLSIAIPAAYTAAVTLEARNLRLIAAGAADQLAPASVRQRLLAA